MQRNAERCGGAALHYKPPDDWVFGVDVGVDICTRRTCALADESNAVRVTTESGNVIADPFNS